jgi:hypothetical protein
MAGTTRKDQKERWGDFLNEAFDQIKLGNRNNMSALSKEHGVSNTLIAFLRQKGVFVPTSKSPRYPQWTTSRTSHFDTEEVDMLITEFSAWRKNGKKMTNVQTSHVNLPPSNGLSKYTTKQLTDELRHRGYSGKMVIKKELTF